ncbi:hypothetical protein, partial [Nostoc sp.]|uniref:hypothetical protein n=1 Tax=Nostoc sp. TaxID=1180 RepID=UPI002FFC910B
PPLFPFLRISVDSQYGHCTVDDLNSSLYYATPICSTRFISSQMPATIPQWSISCNLISIGDAVMLLKRSI